jgi:flagella basal body P-ring formation protein FlgA
LKPQQEIQVSWRKVPIEKLARQPVSTRGVARVSIHAGEPLTRLVVTTAPDLRNGAPVDIVVRRGALTVHAEGTALADATIGGHVPVLNSATKTALQGTLIDSQTVEIR